MDAVQVEPVVPTIGLTAGRDAEITARCRDHCWNLESLLVAHC